MSPVGSIHAKAGDLVTVQWSDWPAEGHPGVRPWNAAQRAELTAISLVAYWRMDGQVPLRQLHSSRRDHT